MKVVIHTFGDGTTKECFQCTKCNFIFCQGDNSEESRQFVQHHEDRCTGIQPHDKPCRWNPGNIR